MATVEPFNTGLTEAQLTTAFQRALNDYTNAQIDAAIASAVAGKQNTLTFDTTPTASSTNPVTSGGVYDALALKADANAVTIPSGADMDTYTAAGSYISTSSTTTGTLLHIPQGVAGKGFALDIIQTAANAIVQRIVCMQVSASQPRVFYRGGRNSEGWTFGAWYEVTMVSEAL